MHKPTIKSDKIGNQTTRMGCLVLSSHAAHPQIRRIYAPTPKFWVCVPISLRNAVNPARFETQKLSACGDVGHFTHEFLVLTSGTHGSSNSKHPNGPNQQLLAGNCPLAPRHDDHQTQDSHKFHLLNVETFGDGKSCVSCMERHVTMVGSGWMIVQIMEETKLVAQSWESWPNLMGCTMIIQMTNMHAKLFDCFAGYHGWRLRPA